MGLLDDLEAAWTTVSAPTAIPLKAGYNLIRGGGGGSSRPKSPITYDTLAQLGIQKKQSTGLVPLSGGRRPRIRPLGADQEAEPVPEFDSKSPEALLANALARLRYTNPEQAEELTKQYGPDIDPKILASVGIKVPEGDDSGLLGKLQRTGMSALGDVTRALNTPVNAVKGPIKAFQEGRPGDALRAPGEALAGKDFGYVAAPEEGGGVLGFGARLAEDIALDPTSYLTLGASGAAKGALRSLAREGETEIARTLAKSGIKAVDREAVTEALTRAAQASGRPNVERAVEKQLLALEKSGAGGVKLGLPFTQGRTVTNFGGRMAPTIGEVSPLEELSNKLFGKAAKYTETRSGVRQAHGRTTADTVGQVESAGRAQGAQAAEDAAKRYSGVLQGHVAEGLTHPELTTGVRKAAEGVGDTVDLTPVGQKALADASTMRAEDLDYMLENHVINPGEVHNPDTYFPHIMTDHLRKQIERNPALKAAYDRRVGVPGAADAAIGQGGHLKERAFDTIDEAEDFWREAGAVDAPGKTLLEHDVFKALAHRRGVAEKAVATRQIGHGLAENLDDGLARVAPALPDAPAGIQAAEKSTAKAVQAAEKRLKYLEGQLSTPSTQKAGQEVTVSAAATKGTSSEMVVDALKHDPVAELALNQRRMNIEQEITALKAERDFRRQGQKQARADFEEKMAQASVPADMPAGTEAVKISSTGERVFMAPEIAKEYKGVQAVLTNDEQLKQWQKHRDAVTRYWKSMVTVLPVRGAAFQIRNMQGNMLLNFVRGVQNPKLYMDAMHLQNKVRKGGEEALSEEERWVWRQAHDQGVLGSSFHNVDFDPAEMPFGGLGQPKDNPLVAAGKHHLKGEGKGIKAGRAFNSAIEDNARLAAFLHYTKGQGMTPFDAAIEVKKGLFDYADLTDFERKALRPYIAFYTFMRKNLTANVAQFAREPGRYTAQAHAYKAMAAGGDDPGGALPQFGVDGGMIPMGGLPSKLLGGGGSPMMIGMDTPLNAAIDTAEPMVKGAALLASKVPGLHGLAPEGGFSEVARKITQVPSGPFVELGRAGVEAQTHTSLLTGAKIPAGAEENKLDEALLPLLGVVRRTGKKIQSGQIANLFAGLNVAPLEGKKGPTDNHQRQLLGLPLIPEDADQATIDEMTKPSNANRSEQYRRLNQVETILTALDKAGLPTPTLSELRELGLIPDPHAKKKGNGLVQLRN